MRVKFQILVLVFCLLLPTGLFAQISPVQDKTKTAQSPEEKAALEKKGMELVEELVTETQSMRLPENRAHILATIAEVLWSRDEKRARALFADAVSNIGQLMGKDPNDPQYYNTYSTITNLRFEIVRLVAQHDPGLAREFLISTRQPPDQNYRGLDADVELETSLAAQMAAKDPKLAFQLAEENLAKGLSSQSIDAMLRLQKIDKEAADKLLDDIIKKIKGTDLTANQQASSMAINLLRVLLQPVRPQQPPPPSGQPQASSSGSQPPAPAYSDQTIRDLIDYVAKSAMNTLSSANLNILNPSSQNSARALYNGLQPLMAQIEKYSPSQAQQLRARFGQLTGGTSNVNQAMQDFRALQQTGATMDVLMDVASKAPPDVRPNLYMTLAMRLGAQGEIDKARQIANDHIPDQNMRKVALQNIDSQVAMQAIQKGKVEDSRQLIAQARTDEEKIQLYCRLASVIAGKGDKKAAAQLLEEARGVLGSRVENMNQLNAQIQLVTTYAPLDPGHAFEIIEPVIDQINALAAATAVLDGFQQPGQQRTFKDGELVSSSNNGGFNQYIVMMGPLAKIDFDRTKIAADRFSRTDVKILAHLAMIRGVLPPPDR